MVDESCKYAVRMEETEMNELSGDKGFKIKMANLQYNIGNVRLLLQRSVRQMATAYYKRPWKRFSNAMAQHKKCAVAGWRAFWKKPRGGQTMAWCTAACRQRHLFQSSFGEAMSRKFPNRGYQCRCLRSSRKLLWYAGIRGRIPVKCVFAAMVCKFPAVNVALKWCSEISQLFFYFFYRYKVNLGFIFPCYLSPSGQPCIMDQSHNAIFKHKERLSSIIVPPTIALWKAFLLRYFYFS